VSAIVPIERIEKRIFVLRGQRVMLSTHLAQLYQVEPKALVQAVKRNLDRFPEDFMFQLTWDELDFLRSQSVILKVGDAPRLRSQLVALKGGRGQHLKYLPYAFTEQGVAMLSSVLRSHRAVQVNIGIMRAFVKLREMLASHKELARRLEELERKYDAQFKVVFEAIRQLMAEPDRPRPCIGFRAQRRG
jgi:hypothetical protein